MDLICQAYQVDRDQLRAPAWIMDGEARFAIQLPEMLKTLLEERFHLVAHRQTLAEQGYALVTAKGGQKLKAPGDLDRTTCESWAPAPPDGNNNETCRKIVRTGDQSVSILMMTNSRFGPTLSTTSRGETTTSDHEFFRITMPTLAEELTGLMDMP